MYTRYDLVPKSFLSHTMLLLHLNKNLFPINFKQLKNNYGIRSLLAYLVYYINTIYKHLFSLIKL
jgi:hypothetical protein